MLSVSLPATLSWLVFCFCQFKIYIFDVIALACFAFFANLSSSSLMNNEVSARQKVSDVEVVATDSPRDDVDEVVGHVAIARVPGHLINNLYSEIYYSIHYEIHILNFN